MRPRAGGGGAWGEWRLVRATCKGTLRLAVVQFHLRIHVKKMKKEVPSSGIVPLKCKRRNKVTCPPKGPLLKFTPMGHEGKSQATLLGACTGRAKLLEGKKVDPINEPNQNCEAYKIRPGTVTPKKGHFFMPCDKLPLPPPPPNPPKGRSTIKTEIHWPNKSCAS